MTSQVQSRQGRAVTIAITSGKGGVGKTNVVINLAVALARLGHRVGILDADFGLGNIDVLLGLTPTGHVGHLLTGEKTVDEITIDGPLGVQIIPASTGVRALTDLTPAQWVVLWRALETTAEQLDFLLIDTAAGISNNVIEPLIMAPRALVVTSFEPTAVVDAYALIKVLTAANPRTEIGLVVNAARDADEAALVFRQLDVASARFLSRSIRYYGFIVNDPLVREAVLVQRPIVDHVPQAPASRCFRILASRLAGTAPAGPGLRLASRGPAAAEVEAEVEAPRCA